jgi:hypothetical protein
VPPGLGAQAGGGEIAHLLVFKTVKSMIPVVSRVISRTVAWASVVATSPYLQEREPHVCRTL